MPKFKFSFEREVTETEGFTRIIDAPSFAEAKAAAANLACDFNHSCPDDCDTIDSGRFELGDFDAVCPPTYRDVDAEPHFVVLPDGQCVPYSDGEDESAPDACDLAEMLDRADQRASTQ